MCSTITTFDNWLADNQARFDVMSLTKAQIVENFACYVVENYSKFNIKQNVNELKAVIEKVCKHFSRTPQRTLDAIFCEFKFGWPSVKDGFLIFKLDYWAINMAYFNSDLYSCLVTRKLKGKGAQQELDRIQEEEQKQEAIRSIIYQNEFDTYAANQEGLLLTNIMPCVCCGELVPVSLRHTQIKKLKKVYCGQCLEDGYTIQQLKKEKAELNKLTKKLKESIKNENE